jgi:dihydropteroate synthase
LISQIIDLSFKDVYERYKDEYRIVGDYHSKNLLALEIRNITCPFPEKLEKVNLPFKKDDNLLIFGLLSNFKSLLTNKIILNNKELKQNIDSCLKNFENYDSISYKIKGKNFVFNKSYVMCILNVTPDSFSDGGAYFDKKAAADHAFKMIDDGADIIDIGGESTRPGSDPVPEQEELNRVIPVLDAVLSVKPDAIISIDTTKHKVADEALKHGASIVNDISGLTFDPEIAGTAKKYGASLIIMHIKGKPKDMQKNPVYENMIEEIYDFLYFQAGKAKDAGISNIFIDPGIGFGKKITGNFEIIKRLGDFKSLGCPIVIGVSRKSFIGRTLNLEINERDHATALVESAAVMNGAKIIRTHNVKFGVHVSKLVSNIA